MPLENTFFASGRDCELACDEAVLGKISEEEGSAYGACLLKSVEQKLHINHRMVMTTNMSTDKKFMKGRIVNIMNRKKKSRITMALAVAIMMVVTGCAYEKQNVDTSKQESLTSEIEETTEGNEPELSEETEGKSESQEESAEPETKNDSQVVKETTEDTSFVEPFGEEMSVDAATEKKMNIFLSNFSEAGLYTYDKEHPDINNICWWVHIWTKINKSENIEYESRSDQTYEKISLEQLNQVTEKYLGITIKDEEAALVKSEWFFFENGNFYSPAADGESYTGLSIVSKVEKLSDGRLKLYYNNYYQNIDAYLEGKDKNFSMTEEEASKNPDYEKSNSGYAIVRTEGSSYILEYLEVRN